MTITANYTELYSFLRQSQRQQLLNQLDEESRLKSKADAYIEALRNKVMTLELEVQREKVTYLHNKLCLCIISLRLRESCR